MSAMEAMAPELPEVASSEWQTIEGVPCQIIKPAGAGDGALPVLIWIHGGGFVIGTAANSEGTARRLANGAGCIVVNVDYPLAPEARFPAGPNACLAVSKWVLANAASLGGDPSRVAVGGDSAGGNLERDRVQLGARHRVPAPRVSRGRPDDVVPVDQGERRGLPPHQGGHGLVHGPLLRRGHRRHPAAAVTALRGRRGAVEGPAGARDHGRVRPATRRG